MEKIRRMSTVLKYVFWVILLIIPAFEIMGWIYFDGNFDSIFIPDHLIYLEGEISGPISQMGRMLGLMASFPQMLLGMYSIWQMVKLFTLYSQGRIFTDENSACYRKAAWVFLLSELINPFVQAGVSYAVTMHREVGERVISISIDDTNIGTVIVACVVLAVSWVMDEGRRLQDEAELTI